MTKAGAIARDMLEDAGLTQIPVDPAAVARRLDITVIRHEADRNLYGMLLRKDGQAVIGINPVHSAEGQRFTLAHLVGHYTLHASRELMVDLADRQVQPPFASLPLDREEIEANRFATALLMPERQVRQAAKTGPFELPRLVSALARQFEVSPMVMNHRLLALGIVLDV